MTYINARGLENLKKYQYKGGDASLIYNHIFSPALNKLVEYVPTTVAPNTITLLGLSCTVLTHFLCAYYTPFMDQPLPSWLYALCGVALLAYQTLDNMDGKQARRTGTSSPLGLIFDHGCDALNCTISACTMASMLQIGPTYLSVVMWTVATVPFFFATWEEYYTGGLFLPIVNGPTEGIIILSGLYFTTAVKGAQIWTAIEPTTGLPYNVLTMLPFSAAAVFTVTYNILNVRRHLSREGRSFTEALTTSVPFLSMIVILLFWFAISPSNVVKHHPRMALWLVGLLFSKLVTHLMVAHVTKEDYEPFRKTLLPLFVVVGNAAYAWLFGTDPLINEELLLVVFLLISALSYAHLIFGVVTEMTAALDIYCFSIKTKRTH